MNLENLKPALYSVKNRKRLGRGQSSGKGGTCTRGNKGAKSRSGNSKKLGFEGGQLPIQRRIPKFGFKNINKKKYLAINLDILQNLVERKKIKKEVNQDILLNNNIINKKDKIKILARGKLKTKLRIYAHSFSKKAINNINKLGGEIIKI
jgi:large subunit ribosomal protein L15